MARPPKSSRVRPNPHTEHLFDPHTGKLRPVICKEFTLIELDHTIHRIDCKVPDDPHPNQPHMAPLESTEAFTSGFIGWYSTQPTDGMSTDGDTP